MCVSWESVIQVLAPAFLDVPGPTAAVLIRMTASHWISNICHLLEGYFLALMRLALFGGQTERNWTNSILEVDEKLKLNLQYNKDLHVLFTGGEMSHRRNYFQSNPMEQDSRLDQSPNPLFSMVFHTATTATAGKKEKKKVSGGKGSVSKPQ